MSASFFSILLVSCLRSSLRNAAHSFTSPVARDGHGGGRMCSNFRETNPSPVSNSANGGG